MRVDFVANASHELRTPLASLLGFIETLQGPARNDAAARERFLEIMRDQAQRMTRLIDDLLSLSRIEMRAHVAADDSRSTSRAIARADGRDACRRWRASAASSSGSTLPRRPVHVLGDRDELLRVVENLVENAVKYGESGGQVDVDARRATGEAGAAGRAARVRDYGPGIAPEHLPRLTERFYRVDVAAEPRAGRHRPRPRHRQAHRQPPSRPADDRERARAGRDLHGQSCRGLPRRRSSR